MLSNFWKGLSFFCMNGHEQPVKMVYQEGSSVFLGCVRGTYQLTHVALCHGFVSRELSH